MTRTNPSGFAAGDAIFARCLVRHADGHRQAKLGATRARTVRAISVGEPKKCVHPATSAKASSMEDVHGRRPSLRTPMAASPSRSYTSEMSAEKMRGRDGWRARRPGMPLLYAEGPRFVGGREHDAAADRNRLAAQARVKQRFDRRIKGVEVRVENGGCGTQLVTPGSSWANVWRNNLKSKAIPARTADTQLHLGSWMKFTQVSPSSMKAEVCPIRLW